MRAVKRLAIVFLAAWAGCGTAKSAAATAPLKVAIIGLVHGHVGGFLGGSALVPAGGIAKRSDVEIVGVVEPDEQLFDSYAKRYGWTPEMHFASIEALAGKTHPDAALVFTSTAGHTKAVEECARLGIHAMMEKPLAVSYRDALAMEEAARRGKIHVLVDYETSWYGSNRRAGELLAQGALGPVVKTVVRDGHSGPKKIHVSPEFFAWLTDPELNGAGALYDFGCYGADLMTWMMKGEAPEAVTAVTRHIQPDVYPKVEDEADVLLTYKDAVAILEGSWNWPFNVKNMDVYGQTGYVKTMESNRVEVRRAGAKEGSVIGVKSPAAPEDDPIHYLAAVIHGDIEEGESVSSLKVNIVVAEILDAARQSAASGKTVNLPLR